MENQSEATPLKQWNKAIQVEVQLDAIATMLREAIKEDHPHGNLITNNIIGHADATNGLHHLYGALTGMDSRVNFEPGQVVAISNITRATHVAINDEWTHKWITPPAVVVLQTDKFKQSGDVEVAWVTRNPSGELKVDKFWTDKTKLTAIAAGNSAFTPEEAVALSSMLKLQGVEVKAFATA